MVRVRRLSHLSLGENNGLDPSILGRYGYLRSESVSGVNVSEFDLFLKRESRKRV